MGKGFEGINCIGVTWVSLRKVRESNNGPPPPQGGLGVHGCLCVKQRVSKTCMSIKLLPCSQNKDTWVHPGFCLKCSENWPEVERKDDGSSDEHEQRHPGNWYFFPHPPTPIWCWAHTLDFTGHAQLICTS